MAQFQIQNLTFSYPGASHCALEQLTFQIHRGDYVLIFGKSGSGKSTLLRQLKSVLCPHGRRSGQILFEDVPLSEISTALQARKIGFVLQDPDDQLVTDKVWHELAFGLENIGMDPPTMRLRIGEMASFFGIQDWFHRDVDTLSGGQKQLLNLASVMVMQPEVLILDEPTSQLDPISASEFLNILHRINRELGTTVIITDHRLEEILPCAHRVLVMEEGRLVSEGTPAQVCRQLWQQGSDLIPALPAAARVCFASGQLEDCPLTVREGRNWLLHIFAHHSPRTVFLPEDSPAATDEAPALTIRHLWLRYERTAPDVLKDVCFSVSAGSIHAIVGGNGAGKTTLLKAICSTARFYRGSISLFGKNIRQYKPDSLFHGCLSLLPQDPKCLFVKASVYQELAEMDPKDTEIQAVARLCRITPLLERHPFDLSGGEQQRCALAKVLLTKPKLLLLDEPTKGLDCHAKLQLSQLLKQLRQEGMTILMVSHDIEFCAQTSDQVSMLFDGQILATTSPRSFFSQNSFYTTSASRMSRNIFQNTITAEDILRLLQENQED